MAGGKLFANDERAKKKRDGIVTVHIGDIIF